MTSTILIVVLIAVPLGFLLGQLIVSRSRGVRLTEATPLNTRTRIDDSPAAAVAKPAPADPWTPVDVRPSTEAMAGKIERLRAERNELRTTVQGLERQVEDLQAEVEGSAAQLLAGARQVERAEEVSRSAGARLVEALSERDEAVERLQGEKANHAETHRSLEAAENYLRLLIGHLDESTTSPDLASEVASLRETVGRLGQQMRSGEPARAAAGRRS